MAQRFSRRSFLSAGAAAAAAGTALTAAGYARVRGANERVGVGFIGYGLIGKRHVLDFREQPDANPVAVAEVHRGRLDEALGFLGPPVRGHADFRRLLDDRDVDAVVVSTPDHWHALMTMLACAAGKDVYVEKPLTLFVREGQWMLDVARRHGRVVQVGTQQRSGGHYRRARDLIHSGHVGRVMSVRMQAARNILPGYGNPPDQDPPPELDWDLWLGPAPERRYNPQRAIYHFRWFWDYSGGQMTNLGQHSLDIVDWVLGTGSLRSVASLGGRFCLKDNGETPDTQDALFDFGQWTATWSHRECARGETVEFPLVFHGTKGSLGISRSGFRVWPDPDVPPESTIPQFTGAHPVGGPQAPASAGPRRNRTEPLDDRSGDGRAQFRDHARNFLDCVKSRETPVSDLESGHRVAAACHLANLSLRLGRSLRWDAE
ncbi:MAG TPA: Gfo/Idh/MocA family oxidoreductase, partial [Planctomycetaceae bacterium]|nr:Gfo/Idh/MocA family oxidoreductase [Planctomycetaceae bacterium]